MYTKQLVLVGESFLKALSASKELSEMETLFEGRRLCLVRENEKKEEFSNQLYVVSTSSKDKVQKEELLKRENIVFFTASQVNAEVASRQGFTTCFLNTGRNDAYDLPMRNVNEARSVKTFYKVLGK